MAKHKMKATNGNGAGTRVMSAAERAQVGMSDVERLAALNPSGSEKRTPGGAAFKEISTTGLRRFGGHIQDDYDRIFRTVSRRVALYREMGDDPVAAAIMQAITMTLMGYGWYTEAGGEKTSADEAAAEFIEQARDDMSLTWNDLISNALFMLQYGFQLGETVYKKRNGEQPLRIEESPPLSGGGPAQSAAQAEDRPASKYDDGRIGWRKVIFVAPETLTPGNEWVFDAHGGLRGFNQTAPPDYRTVSVPIDKTILFRTTTQKGNPEGESLFRKMYSAWFLKKNLEEVEAISAERLGAGLPIAYLGKDVGKGTDSNSDLSVIKGIVRNIRADEQAGIVLPWAKMGAGAEPGKGVLLELLSPPTRGNVDFNATITRHEQRMAMVGLAQFIHLGMNQVGARALGESSQDFFTTAVSAWADALAETLQRFMVERLIRLNYFPGLTGMPLLKHETIGMASLAGVADYVNKLAGAAIINYSTDLEDRLLEMAELPTPDRTATLTMPAPAATPEIAPGTGTQAGLDKGAGANDNAAALRLLALWEAEAFQADKRGQGKAGAKTKAIVTVNRYQDALTSGYDDWSEDLAADLAEADEDKRDELIAAALLTLLALLDGLGKRYLPEAIELGLAGELGTAEIYSGLAAALTANETYLTNSLIPDIRAKLAAALLDPDVKAALAVGGKTAAAALNGVLDTLGARVSLYAGQWWDIYNLTVGLAADEAGDGVDWFLDPRARHCADCPAYGSESGTHYASYADMLAATGGKAPARGVECGGNCRCELKRSPKGAA